MQTVLVNLADLAPAVNGGTSRLAHEVAHVLLEWSRSSRDSRVVFVVGWRFAANFVDWLGEDAPVTPYFFPFDARSIYRIAKPELIVSPLFGMAPFSGSAFARSRQIVSMPDTLALDKPELFSRRHYQRRLADYRPLAHASAVVTLSVYSRERLQHHLHLPAEQVRVIPLGGDTFAPAAPGEMGEALPERYVFYPANIWRHKRHDLLFRTMKRVWQQQPDMHLVLSGGRGLGFATEIPDLIRQYDCPDGLVIDLGYVSDARLRNLYEHAEALVFTSEYEGFGMPLVEAMTYGCPVICASLASIPEIVGDAGLYVDSDDAADWADALLRQLPLQRGQLIAKGYARARQFTWANTRQQWKTLFGAFGLNSGGVAETGTTEHIDARQRPLLAQLGELVGRAPITSRRDERVSLLRNYRPLRALRRDFHALLRADGE